MQTQKVDINTLIPYWRNPRDNNNAIAKVKRSIEQFGYQAPIIVDKKMTIIVGHTRYRALKELGYTEIDVIVTDMEPKKAKEYRIIDNRTSEYSDWTDELTLELKEFTDPEFRDYFFPEINLEPDFKRLEHEFSEDKISKAEEHVHQHMQNMSDNRDNEPRLEITCPHCLETISILRRDLNHDKNWTV